MPANAGIHGGERRNWRSGARARAKALDPSPGSPRGSRGDDRRDASSVSGPLPWQLPYQKACRPPRATLEAEAAKANMATQRLIRMLIEAQLAKMKAKATAPREPSHSAVRSAKRAVRASRRSGRHSGVGPLPESDHEPEIIAPEELLADMPLPSDAKTFFLGGLFVLAMLTAVYVASEIVLPMIFAVMLNLLLQPALRSLERLRVPRVLGSIVLILVVFAAIVGIGAAVSGPAETWIAKLPEGIPRIVQRLRFLEAPINTLKTFLAAANNFGSAGPQRSSAGPFDGGAILSSVFAGTRSFASGLFTTVMFLYFLLVAGDSFLRRLVEVLPRFASKRQAVDISQQIGHDISAYLLTISLMNALVGVATALVMWLTGVGDPVLWGTDAFILNYVPIFGPAAGFFIWLNSR